MENSDSNSRLVVDENDNGKFRLERGNYGRQWKVYTRMNIQVYTVQTYEHSGVH